MAREQGAWYPRWYWPSFAAPGALWVATFFALPLYLVFAVAFGTVDTFGSPFPIYQPYYWSFEQFNKIGEKICCGEHAFYQPTYIRTFVYVAVASAICLTLGYTVAYFVARFGGKRRTLLLVLLVMPFWISYLMRMYAWQSLLQDDGLVNTVLLKLHLIGHPVFWTSGKHITVIMGLVYGYIPYMILPLYGALDRINQSLLEAGRDLGASPTRTFFRVTLPLSKQAILAGLVIVSLPMFGDYYTNSLLSTNPKTRMIGNLIDFWLNLKGGSTKAASLVITLIVILIVPMMYYLYSTKRVSEHV